YTDPNPFKEFHLGHMYSNFIGESVSRLFEACGAKVWRGDFYGDVGMHVAKSVWGMMEKMAQEKITLDDLNNLSIKERQKFLGRCYAAGVRKFEEDKTIQEKIRELNSLIYVAGQEALRKSKDWQPIVDYRQYIVGREEMLPKVQRIYEAGLHWSLEYFETIYQRLRTKFDGYYPESWAGEYGMKLVEKGLKIGALEKSEGTVVYRGEKDGLHTRVFVNKLGLPTYEAKDLGLALAKYQDFKYDVSINVFGREIDEYYKVVRAAMRKIIPELGSKAYYIAHGMVRLPEGKMSSRTGNVVTFEWLLDEAKKYALKIMKDIDLGEAEKQTVAQEVGVGAVRYALLKNSPGNDVVFDFDKSVSFEGDSGPYLMYTYARCKSVIRKANDLNSKLKSLSRAQSRDQNSKVQLKTQKSESAKDTWKVTLDGSFQVEEAVKYLNSEELSLLRAIYRFPEVVVESTRTLSPNLVCSFLFDLAQKYNLFYNKHSILNPAPRHIDGKTPGRWPAHSYAVVAGLLPGGGISKSLFEVEGSEDADYRVKSATFRLALTAATAQILKQGLYLLGIETVERM
ncbi:arginine--tRNA ligase, partial [Candidatus Gottesmanbacteria bacterium]|nr:arginine--tRNA ligase [Candidatus Gottesmanbacteria bacterium]